jgi:hypothetical protein
MPQSTTVHPPLALTTVALFDQHPPMNALPEAGLRGKCPNGAKSDFLSPDAELIRLILSEH